MLTNQFVHCFKGRKPCISDKQEMHHKDLYFIHCIPGNVEVSLTDFQGVSQHGVCAKYECCSHISTPLWYEEFGKSNGDRLDIETEIYDCSQEFLKAFRQLDQSIYTQLPTDEKLMNITDMFDKWVDTVRMYSNVVKEIYES